MTSVSSTVVPINPVVLVLSGVLEAVWATALAVWVGVGAVLTVLVAVVRKEEKLGVAKALLLAALIGCVIG